MRKKNKERIESFRFLEGEILSEKYEVIEFLGSGWEGEVYKLREKTTGIERAGKFFFPHRNPRNKSLKFHAKKLHKLRGCPIVIQYITQEQFTFQGSAISYLVSEYVEGELLSHFVARQRGRRLGAFQAFHLLYALARGIESVHQLNEYHGDLHTDNIIVKRHGLGFDLKVVDMFSWGFPRNENIQNDVIDLVSIFYEVTGGQKHYARQPKAVKSICCGLKKSLILSKFRTASKLKGYLENMDWE